jgi:hypothetical protein
MNPSPLDLDLPKRLAAADGQALKQALEDELQRAHENLLVHVRTGCERGEFKVASQLLEAVAAGREVLGSHVVPTPTTSLNNGK